MENLQFYNKLKTPPKAALKTIHAGRLKGMTDIKPQWRILVMTETFGACGIGWYYDNVHYEYKQVANEEVVCNCRLNLYVKIDNEWSKPIFGTGGSKLTAKETNGLYNSDEAEKMAMTDALSVAMKALGVAGDIYLGYSDSKYEPNTIDIDSRLSECKTQGDLTKLFNELNPKDEVTIAKFTKKKLELTNGK